MLELIGTKKFMGTGTPFLVEKRDFISGQFALELGCAVPQPCYLHSSPSYMTILFSNLKICSASLSPR